MNLGNDTVNSLESWLATSYTRFLQALQEYSCKTGPGGIHSGGTYINMSPFLPIEVDACFLESTLDKYTLDLAGAMYRVLELVVDMPTRRVLAANVIVQESGKPVHITRVDIGSIQLQVTDAIGKQTSIAALHDAALEVLLAAAKTAKSVGGTAIPPVDVLRVVDSQLHERLMEVAKLDSVSTTLDSIARGAATLLAGCRDGLVRYHPVKDKLAAFMCKAGSAIKGPVIEDIAAAGSTFLPNGSSTVVLYTGEAMTAFRAERSKNGVTTISGLRPHGIDGMLPIAPDMIDPIAKKLHHDTGVDVVLFFSIDTIVESITMIIDGVAALEHEKNGPMLTQSILEAIGFYARTFKQTWYSRPRAMVTKLFPRFLLRFTKIRLDLPRFLHDKAAMSLVSAALGSFGKDFSIVVCFPVQEGGRISFKIIDISVNNLVPVGLASIDPAVLSGININTMDASNLAQIVHARLVTTAPVSGSRFVLVVGPKVAATIASAWKSMFRRVAWNPFALLNVLKRCKDPKSLGLHPMPQAIVDLIKQNFKAVARQLSSAFFLKY